MSVLANNYAIEGHNENSGNVNIISVTPEPDYPQEYRKNAHFRQHTLEIVSHNSIIILRNAVIYTVLRNTFPHLAILMNPIEVSFTAIQCYSNLYKHNK